MFSKKPSKERLRNTSSRESAPPANGTGEPDQQGDLIHPRTLALTSRRDLNMCRVRQRSHAVYVGEGLVLCWVLGRYKFYVQSSDVGFGAHLILDGFWEMWVTEFIARCVREGMTVFDLGANHGYFTLLAADLAGPTGTVLAVEPNPIIRQILKQNVDVNGFSSRVMIDDRALWNKTGEMKTFVIPDREPKNARVIELKLSGSQYKHIEVSSLALDDLKDLKVDFIKADIEGAEEQMWAGMQMLLDRNQNLIFLLEFAAARCVNPRALLEQMSERFQLQYLDVWSTVKPVTIDELLASSHDWMLVFSRNPLPPAQ